VETTLVNSTGQWTGREAASIRRGARASRPRARRPAPAGRRWAFCL